MASDSPEEIHKNIKQFWTIGIILCICTCITVALGKLDFLDFYLPGIDWVDIVIGLLVAVIKSSLVALIFMHLNHEKGLVYKTLLFTLAFATSLMGLTLFAKADPIKTHADVVDEVQLVVGHDESEDHAEEGAH